MPSTLLSALVAIFVISRVVNYLKARKQTGYLPAMSSLLTPISVLGATIPTYWWNPGVLWQWHWRGQVYSRLGADTIATLPYLFGAPTIYTSSLDVLRQVVSTRGQFFKSPDTSAITLLWGPNIFAANGDEWRRHRRIMSPTFTTQTHNEVWKQGIRVFDEMVEDLKWDSEKTVNVPSINVITTKFALIIISTCGFGNPLSWRFPPAPAGKMSFAEALTIMSESNILRLIIPRWMYWLPISKIRNIEIAYQELATSMQQWIDTRMKDVAAGENTGNDVLSLMIKSCFEEGKYTMSSDELIGNTFLLLLAGHDTTALTLAAVCGFLALDQKIQEEVHRELLEVMPTEADMTFANSSRLVKTQACFIEASRMFPAGFLIMRDAAEDLILNNVGPNGDETVAIEKGTRFVGDMISLHYHPKYFPDPESFKPERWYGAHENEFTMFSVGPRACIGRRFAITEGICFLVKLLRGWKVEALAREGETAAQWKSRVMQGEMKMNFGVKDVPLRLVRRV